MGDSFVAGRIRVGLVLVSRRLPTVLSRLVERGRPFDGAGDGEAAVILAVPLLAVQARAGDEGSDALLVVSHPECEHGAEGEIGLGVRGVVGAVTRPQPREPVSAPGAHRSP